MICGEVLFNAPSIPVAACTQFDGTEHSHSDEAPGEAVLHGSARSLTVGEPLWCLDEHHGTPCRFDRCAACSDECSGIAFTTDSGEYARWTA